MITVQNPKQYNLRKITFLALEFGFEICFEFRYLDLESRKT